MRVGSTTRALILASLAGSGAALAGLLTEQQTDQVRRDLIRVFAEVFQRAKSQALLDEVVRPRYGSPQVDLPESARHGKWRPDCTAAISAEASDPKEFPFALVLADADDVADSGATFTVYAVFVGDNPVRAEFLADSPAWLAEAKGGYDALEADLKQLLSRSTVTIETSVCDGFSYATITGRTR